MSALNWGGWPSVQGAAVDSQGELEAKIHLTATTIDALNAECDDLAAGFVANEAGFAQIAAAQAATGAGLTASTTDVRISYTPGVYPIANKSALPPLPFGNDAGTYLVYVTFSMEGAAPDTFGVQIQIQVSDGTRWMSQAASSIFNSSQKSPAFFYWIAAIQNPMGMEARLDFNVQYNGAATVSDMTIGQLKF